MVPSRPKYPFIVKTADGKQWKCTIDTVLTAKRRAEAAAAVKSMAGPPPITLKTAPMLNPRGGTDPVIAKKPFGDEEAW